MNCQFIHNLAGRLDRHAFPFEPEQIPESGVYLLFEAGETAHGGDRIVYAGTHTGEQRLRNRLLEHLIPNKDRSIFRKNIGRAILRKKEDPFLDKWEIDLTTRKAREKYAHLIDTELQKIVEEEVTDVIEQTFSFAVLPEENREDRLLLRKKIVSVVSLCGDCVQSKQWLGVYSPKKKIRESGLWLVNGLYKELSLSAAEIDILQTKCERSLKRNLTAKARTN